MSSQIRRQDTVAFSLSFLDILSCGLGAALLLLLVVKHGSSEISIDSEAFVLSQLQRIQSVLDQKLEEKSSLDRELAASVTEIDQAISDQEALSAAQAQRMAEIRTQLASLQIAKEQLQSTTEDLKMLQAERDAAVPIEVDPVVDEPPTGQLAGLKVQDSRVVILLDQSASMLDRSLVEIIRLRIAGATHRKAAEKWTTARETAKWAYQHIQTSEVFQLLAFSEDVIDITEASIPVGNTINWLTKGQGNVMLQDVDRFLDDLDPAGPTNLELAFDVAASLTPSPMQIILITDGLPTVPGIRPLGRVSGCPSPSRGKTPILKPGCRQNIFRNAEQALKKKLPSVEISVVLLPLDGDAQAMHAYWQMAAPTGGRVLTPATGWP